MKNNLFRSCIYAAALSVFYACSPDEQVVADLDKISSFNDAVMADKISFDNGDIRTNNFVTTVNSDGGATVTVNAFQRFYSGAGNYSLANPGKYSADNRANLFNTNNAPIAPSDDQDLSAASQTGNALIINHNDNHLVPDDYAWGGTMNVYFTSMGPVTLHRLTYLDNEEGIIIRLYNTSNTIAFTTTVNPGGNASSQIVELGDTPNVIRMEIIQGQDATPPNVPNGSGAIDDIELTREVPEDGCTRTQGYWKNHASGSKKPDPAWAKLMPNGENTTFFSSGKTYLSIFDVQPRGNAYYILAHQYVAATLNLESGATMPVSVMNAYNSAKAFFGSHGPGQTTVSKNQLTQWASILDDYNNGITGPGHCD